LTGLAFALDDAVQDYFQQNQPISNVSHYGDSWGQGYVLFGLGAAMFAAGEIIDNKQLADTGAVSIEALAVTGIATESLKYLTHRERPNHQDNMSVPSGHASMTAAFAASVSEMYDWSAYVAVPLFAASAFVGASRIQDNMHYFSDVVAGWTLGTVVGISFGRIHKEKNSEARGEKRLSVAPFADGGSRGVVFNLSF
jgi:membrane-associated phospholipid phosphatase